MSVTVYQKLYWNILDSKSLLIGFIFLLQDARVLTEIFIMNLAILVR